MQGHGDLQAVNKGSLLLLSVGNSCVTLKLSTFVDGLVLGALVF